MAERIRLEQQANAAAIGAEAAKFKPVALPDVVVTESAETLSKSVEIHEKTGRKIIEKKIDKVLDRLFKKDQKEPTPTPAPATPAPATSPPAAQEREENETGHIAQRNVQPPGTDGNE